MADRIHYRMNYPGALLILAAVSLSAFWIDHKVWWSLTLILMVWIGGSAVWTWQLGRHLTSHRQITREFFSVGDRLIEQISISNGQILPAIWLLYQDFSNIPGYRTRVAYELPSNFTLHWRSSAACRRRGRYQIGPWQLTSGDPFGLFEVELFFDQQHEIVILPPTDVLIQLDTAVGRLPGTRNVQLETQQTTEHVSTLRDYHPGDPLRWVHWPTTARLGSLAVREFEQNTRSDVWIVVDGFEAAQLGNDLDSTEEIAVLLAAAIAQQQSASGRKVGLIAVGEQVHLVSPGKRLDIWPVLYELAIFSAQGTLPVQKAISNSLAAIKNGSSMVVITPDFGPELLEILYDLSAKQIRVTLIGLDRPSFGDTSADPHPQGTADQIRQIGHEFIPVRLQDIQSPTYERGKLDQFVTTPFGKAIEKYNE